MISDKVFIIERLQALFQHNCFKLLNRLYRYEYMSVEKKYFGIINHTAKKFHAFNFLITLILALFDILIYNSRVDWYAAVKAM